MKGERTTPGNNYKLTKSQHVIPQASIRRFCNDDEQVLVNLIRLNKSFLAKSDNGVFCVNRVWDQRGESGWMLKMENNYQKLASLIYNGLQLKLEQSQNEIISKMYLLIYMRRNFSEKPVDDYQVHGIERLAYSPSKEEMEHLESQHIASVDANGVFNSRHITSSVMQSKIHQQLRINFKGIEWEIVKSENEDYIFSDCYNGYKVLPISPKFCFIASKDLADEPKLNDSSFVNSVGKRYAIDLFFNSTT